MMTGHLCTRLLGMDKLLQYTLNEWLGDIKKNQIPSILGGVGPMYSFVQIGRRSLRSASLLQATFSTA